MNDVDPNYYAALRIFDALECVGDLEAMEKIGPDDAQLLRDVLNRLLAQTRSQTGEHKST